MTRRFWSDDFDMDLLKLFPDLPDRIGPAVDIPLWTHGGESYGRLNHPSVWGHVAFFGLTPGQPGKPAEYYTDAPVIECTWLEALRDAWPHTYMVVIDNCALVWSSTRLQATFTKLMYDLRGWQKLPNGAADRLKGQVLASILAATRDLLEVEADRMRAVASAARQS